MYVYIVDVNSYLHLKMVTYFMRHHVHLVGCLVCVTQFVEQTTFTAFEETWYSLSAFSVNVLHIFLCGLVHGQQIYVPLHWRIYETLLSRLLPQPDVQRSVTSCTLLSWRCTCSQHTVAIYRVACSWTGAFLYGYNGVLVETASIMLLELG